MNDPRLLQFLQSVGQQTVVLPYQSDDDEQIVHFVWLLNVPLADLCDVEDRATDLAFSIFGADPLPFFLGVATPEKTRTLLAQNIRVSNGAALAAVIGMGIGLARGRGTGASVQPHEQMLRTPHASAGTSNTAGQEATVRGSRAMSRAATLVFTVQPDAC